MNFSASERNQCSVLDQTLLENEPADKFRLADQALIGQVHFISETTRCSMRSASA